MGKSLVSNHNDFLAAMQLYCEASSSFNHLLAVGDLLSIHEKISNPADKANLGPFINFRIDYYVGSLEYSIKQVNTVLTFTKNPGLVATAVRFREELQNGPNLLKSLAIR